MKLQSDSSQKTIDFAKSFSKDLKGGEVIYLIGDLGAGKTQFTKGIALGLDIKEEIVSPTFILMRKYKAEKLSLVHVDLYRIEDFNELGFRLEDEINKESVMFIEWADKFIDKLPKPTYTINLTHLGENKREIIITQH